MKILFITNRIPYPQNDGGSLAMYAMMKGLKEAGAELSLFSLNTNKHYVNPKELPDSFISLFEETSYASINTGVTGFGAFKNLFTKQSYNISRFESTSVRTKLNQFLEGRSFDMVQYEGLYVSMYVGQVKALLPTTKQVLRCHNLEYEIWERRAVNSSGIKKQYIKLLAKRLKKYELDTLPYFDALIPVSERDKQIFNKLCDVQQFVAPIGLDVVKSETIFHKKNHFFFLGSLDWKPNLKGLIWFIENCWIPFYKDNSSQRFIIAGKSIPDSVNKYDYKNGIQVVGEVTDATSFMISQGVMVVPLFSGSGTRVKIIQAMLLGKCVLSTTIGAEGIPVNKGKDILLGDTADELLMEMNQLEEEKVKEIGIVAKKKASEYYDLTRISEALFIFYDGITS
ncbi:MAG: glycosyltransferase family 4 protein [Cyclobacteriaceae bacterium]